MTIAATDFVAAFPEFNNPVSYPISTISFWLTQGYNMLNSVQWGSQIDLGVMLYTAHRLALAARAAFTANAGGVPGINNGVVSSKSVGGVSMSYDVAAGSKEGAGFYNLTTYGVEFYHMVMMFGAGPVQVGPDINGVPGTLDEATGILSS